MDKKYDVGLVGCWYWGNYGSLLNGYATYKILTSFGLKVLNIVTPNNGFEQHAKDFFSVAYPKSAISKVLPFDRLDEYNDICDTFVTGSDQIWNTDTALPYAEYFRLNFVRADKRKISFSTSYGSNAYCNDELQRKRYSALLKRYNRISVREDSAVGITKSEYGANAVQVMEPVMDVDVSVWNELASHSRFPQEKEPYIITYILDPTPEKKRAIEEYSKKLNIKAINILDGFSGRYGINAKKLGLPNTLPTINCCDFLQFYRSAKFVITDSFHGTAFAMLFQKPFISIANKSRGLSRFESILSKTDLMGRLVDASNIPVDEKLCQEFDYKTVNKIVEKERQKAVKWLKDAVNCPLDNKLQKINNITEYLSPLRCMGCGACVSACPVNALTLKADEFGYYRSTIDYDKCIDCGICVTKCAALKLPRNLNAKTPISYAFVNNNQNVLMSSTSGGIFTVLAEEVLKKGGSVAGASWNDDFGVEHIIVDKAEDIDKLRKSKYVQSYLGTVFKDVKNRLDSGKPVLFSGCPCQVAGLNKFLDKRYDNLITVDLFCAASPSLLFFQKYLDEKFGKENVVSFRFRHKRGEDKIWDAYTYEVTFKDGTKKSYRMTDTDYYRNMQIYVPHHCRQCNYQGTTRVGDLTIGDCWGIQNYDTDIDVRYGVSAIFINNEKGEKFFNSIPIKNYGILKEEPLDEIKKYNVCTFQENRNWPANEMRDAFYQNISSHSYMYSMEQALKYKK